jgi:hypothetical protein
MKISLECFRASEKIPEPSKNILIIYEDTTNAVIGGQTISIKDVQDWGWKDAEKIYWAYFNFQPERSKREDAVIAKLDFKKLGSLSCCNCSTAMRCSEHGGNIVRDK